MSRANFFNMFGEQEDLDTMIRAIRYSGELFNYMPLVDLVDGELSLGPKLVSDEELGVFSAARRSYRQHPVGTALWVFVLRCKLMLN